MLFGSSPRTETSGDIDTGGVSLPCQQHGDIGSQLQSFQQSLQLGVLLVQMGNITVISYLIVSCLVLSEPGRGTRSHRLNRLAQEIIQWYMYRIITIQAIHLSGVENVQADRLYHHLFNHQDNLDKSAECFLNQGIANLLFNLWESPWVDLFLTSNNAKVPVFFSRASEPSAC